MKFLTGIEYHDLLEEQFLLARYGISITESNMLADFEREAFVSLAIQHIKRQNESLSLSHLAEEN